MKVNIMMMKSKTLSYLIAPVILIAASIVSANTAGHLDKAPVDLSNHASIQRGAKTFVNYCLNCHSANYMRYNRLVAVGLTEKQIKDNLLLAGEKVGDAMTVAMKPEDASKWLGATPPDLSVEVRARGADWIYTYMRGFYRDNTRPTGWNNVAFDKVGMPHVLYQLQGEQVLNHETHQLELAKPGKLTTAEYDAVVGDLVNYMAFMAEPAKAQRIKMGWYVLLFLSLLLVLAYKLKKAYWREIH